MNSGEDKHMPTDVENRVVSNTSRTISQDELIQMKKFTDTIRREISGLIYTTLSQMDLSKIKKPENE